MHALNLLLGKGPTAGPLGQRIALFFAALFLAYGVVVPYLPVWLHTRGLDPLQISTVVSAPLFIRLLVTPGVGLLADRLGDYRRVIVVLAWSAFAFVLGLGLARGSAVVMLLGILFLLTNGTMLPLVETIAVRGVRREGLDYGRMRLWGSVTFIIANFVGGLAIEALGGNFALWMIAAGVMLTIAAALVLPQQKSGAKPSVGSGFGWRTSSPARLLGSPLFVLFLIAIGCTHGAHATFYTFSALHWQSQGLPAAWVGALWAIGVFAEVVLFAFSAPIVQRIGPAQLIAAGAVTSILRWGLMALDPPLGVLIPLQVLHAITYGAAHLGAILFISRAVPHSATGSAQALFATIASGLAQGVIGLISGALYASLGGLVFLVPTGVAIVGSIAGVMLLRGWSGGPLWDEPAAEAVAASPTTPAPAD